MVVQQRTTTDPIPSYHHNSWSVWCNIANGMVMVHGRHLYRPAKRGFEQTQGRCGMRARRQLSVLGAAELYSAYCALPETNFRRESKYRDPLSYNLGVVPARLETHGVVAQLA